MKLQKLLFLLFCSASLIFAQITEYKYDQSNKNPYGSPNPNAPKQILDFEDMIGECECKSISRNADQTWGDTVNMVWRFKYIMNGMAIQDETLKEDGLHSGSIRQFIPDSSKWYVHYYSSGSPSTQLPVWEGTKNENGNIILYKDQTAPNGTEGYYKITFSEISKSGFNWLGEWVNKTETFSYPTWKIYCQKID